MSVCVCVARGSETRTFGRRTRYRDNVVVAVSVDISRFTR